jgi:hypothetical protein
LTKCKKLLDSGLKIINLGLDIFFDGLQTQNVKAIQVDWKPSARTAFLSIDMQVDFCGPKGYVDVKGYDLGLTSAPIKPIMHVLDTIRK